MTKEIRSPKLPKTAPLAGSRNGSLLAHASRLAPTNGEVARAGEYSVLDLAKVTRFVLMITPRERGSFREQMEEVLAVMRRVLNESPQRAAITIQTVFLREASDQAECAAILSAHYGAEQPVTNIVLQGPCCGAAVAVEAWAIRGDSARVEHFGPQALVVEYDGLRWVHCGGITPAAGAQGVYGRAASGFEQMGVLLARSGSRFGHVVRTWLYLGGITEPEAETCRYQELNRARQDFYSRVRFGRSSAARNGQAHSYPASTGIGMSGTGLVMSCLALETEREDVFLLPLENPQQTPAYDYPGKDRGQIPQFARAMALVSGDYVTTWISGTASIVNSESCHIGDIEGQTKQTLDNIEHLISPENFQRHGLPGAGASLNDLAKIRVYLKRGEDLDRCRSVCEGRLGAVPAIYLTADVCRPDLLVEIEGVAFSKCMPLTPP